MTINRLIAARRSSMAFNNTRSLAFIHVYSTSWLNHIAPCLPENQLSPHPWELGFVLAASFLPGVTYRRGNHTSGLGILLIVDRSMANFGIPGWEGGASLHELTYDDDDSSEEEDDEIPSVKVSSETHATPSTTAEAPSPVDDSSGDPPTGTPAVEEPSSQPVASLTSSEDVHIAKGDAPEPCDDAEDPLKPSPAPPQPEESAGGEASQDKSPSQVAPLDSSPEILPSESSGPIRDPPRVHTHQAEVQTDSQPPEPLFPVVTVPAQVGSDDLFQKILADVRRRDPKFPSLVTSVRTLRARESQLMDKTSQLMSAHQELERVKGVLRRTKGDLDSTSSELAAARKRGSGGDRWKAVAKKREAEYDELLEEGKELAAEIGALKNRLVTLATTIKERDGTIASLRSELSGTKRSLSSATVRAEQADVRASETRAWEQEKESLERNLEAAKNRVVELEDDLKIREREFRESLEMANEEREVERSELMETITQLQLTLRNRTEESLRKIAGLSRELGKLQTTAPSHKEMADDVSSGPFLAQIAELESKAQEKESEWRRVKRQLESEAAILRQTIALNEQREASFDRRIAALQAEKDRLSMREASQAKLCAEAKTQLQGEILQREELQRSYGAEVRRRGELERLVAEMKKDALVASLSPSPTPPPPPAESDASDSSSTDGASVGALTVVTPKKKKKKPRKRKFSRRPRPRELLVAQLEQLRTEHERVSGLLTRSQRDNARLRETVARTDELKKELDGMKLRYAAAREIVAEKNVEIRDLKGDFSHAKQMFQKQVVQLLAQLEQVQKKKNAS